MKEDDLSPPHLEWLVRSRAENQTAALALFKLFEIYPTQLKSKTFSQTAQVMVSVCFSLWRAAFLADKTGKRHAVIKDARAFLSKMLVDNAITYPQDRGAREWTFNYYMNNAKDGLARLAERWSRVGRVLLAEQEHIKGTTASEHRWTQHQRAFEAAVKCIADDLDSHASD